MRSSFLLMIQPRAIKSRLPSSTATAVDAMVYYLRNIFRIVKSISYYLIGRTPTLRLASVSKRGLRAKSALVCKDEKGRLGFAICYLLFAIFLLAILFCQLPLNDSLKNEK